MELKRDINIKLQRTEDLLEQPSIDTDVKQECEAEMQDIYRELVALQSEKAFKKHASRVLSDAFKARQQGKRDDPLCTCSRPTCSLKRGSVPPQARTRGSNILQTRSSRDLMAEYVQDHNGAEIVHELLDEWEAREGSLYRNLSQVHARLERAAPKPKMAAVIGGDDDDE